VRDIKSLCSKHCESEFISVRRGFQVTPRCAQQNSERLKLIAVGYSLIHYSVFVPLPTSWVFHPSVKTPVLHLTWHLYLAVGFQLY